MVAPVTDTAMADEGISGVCGVGDMPGYGSLKYRRPVGARDRIVSDVRDEAHLNARRATQGKYE